MTPCSMLPCTTFRDWLAILCLLLSGCFVAPGSAEPVPRQEEAVRIAWSFYGSPKAPPQVLWVRAPELNCYPDEAGVFWGWMSANANSPEPECVGGLTSLDARASRVAYHTDGMSLRETALKHELYHMALFDLTGDGDGWHEGPGWGRYTNDGYQRGILDDVDDAYALEGL